MQNKKFFAEGNCWDPVSRLFLILLGFLIFTFSVLATDVYPISRRGGLPNNLWTTAGVPGGRPQIRSIFTNLSPGIALSQLNAAIAACPSNQVVQLASGTFNLLGTVNLTKDGVVLRGATNALGFPATTLQNTCIQTSPYWYPGGPGGGWPDVSVLTVTSVLSEGTTSLAVSDTPGNDFAVGDIFMLDQLDDGTLVQPDNQVDVFKRNGRSYGLPLHITAVSGKTLSFEPPLLGTYWNPKLTPQIVGWSSQLGSSAKRIGLENLDVTTCGSLYTIRLGPSYACWVRNVRVPANYAAGIRASYMVNCEVTHSLFHDSTENGSGTYAMIIGVDTSCRFEDNIFSNLSLAMPINSAVGCSISYNFGTGPYPYSQPGWLAEYVFTHGGHSHHSLLEGNWLEGPLQFDHLYNSNISDNGVVRNRLRGWASGKILNLNPIILERYQNTTTIIGNLLGENTYHTSYSQMVVIDPTCNGTLVSNNFNTVNQSVPNAEAIGSSTMRDSYGYATKPDWFGDRPWPPFDPANGAAIAANSTAFTNLPAGYRYFFGMDPPQALERTPLISITPLIRQAGVSAVGSTNDLKFTVRNVGGGTLAGSAKVAPPFSVVGPDAYSLGTKASQLITIRYSLTEPGAYSRVITFTGGGGANATVTATATAP